MPDRDSRDADRWYCLHRWADPAFLDALRPDQDREDRECFSADFVRTGLFGGHRHEGE